MQLSASEFCWMVRSRASVCSFKMVCSVFSGAPVSMWSGSQGFRMECQNVFKVFLNGLAKLCGGVARPSMQNVYYRGWRKVRSICMTVGTVPVYEQLGRS